MADMKPEEMRFFKKPEKTRTYHFPEGDVTLQNVVALCVRPSGTHRLQTADGKKHVVRAGWFSIELDMEEWSF